MNTNKTMSKSISDIMYDYTKLTVTNNLYPTEYIIDIDYIDKNYLDKQSIIKILENNPELMDEILVEMRNKKIKKLKN